MSLNLLTSYRLLLRLAKVATVDSVHGRERLADALKTRFRRYKPLRVANVQPVAPEIEAEAVLRFLGNLRRNHQDYPTSLAEFYKFKCDGLAYAPVFWPGAAVFKKRGKDAKDAVSFIHALSSGIHEFQCASKILSCT